MLEKLINTILDAERLAAEKRVAHHALECALAVQAIGCKDAVIIAKKEADEAEEAAKDAWFNYYAALDEAAWSGKVTP